MLIRYAANLLFEYRIKEAPSPRPLCERRIVVFRASGARDAIRRAKRRGRQGEFSYRNADDQTVQIKFIGLIDVIGLEACEQDEAYYSLRRTSNPVRHVRPDDRLSVVVSESKTIGSSWWAVPKKRVAPKARPDRSDKRRRV
jgi:hypothetical protein